MNVNVPDEVGRLLENPSQPEVEIRTRLAAHFYATREIGVGKAAEIAGMKRWEFEAWLHAHGIDMPWTDADLQRELVAVDRLASRTDE